MLAATTHELPLITTIAAAFAAAWVLGIITQKLKLSPIVGYLLAGIAIGPHTPGFVGDTHLASQLAELGVMLLMFGVGLHFNVHDLLAVRRVAVPGAVAQSLLATLLGCVVAHFFGWPLRAGMVLGMALAVASTVVLLRVLMDNKLLDSPAGHVAVGWLIVEDLFTVVVLVLIPALGTSTDGGAGHANLWVSLPIALLKLGAMVAIVLVGGSRVVPWIMVRVARLRSRELFTLTVLVMAVTVAAGSQFVFGASMALGAFLAGMVVGRSPVAQQAAADALPLRDAFAVLFFTSVGMLFDPMFVVRQPGLFFACLAIVLLGKPLAAIVIVALRGYPVRTGIVVSLGLAQVGEFSFILSELGKRHGLLNDDGHNVLVACAIVSITLNPVLMRSHAAFETTLQRFPSLWRFLNSQTVRKGQRQLDDSTELLHRTDTPLAVILGYGPVGRTVDAIIRKTGLETVIVDLNMDTIEGLTRKGRLAIYGDADNVEVMAQALPRATHLVITLPHASNRNPIITTAKLINPKVKVFVRARYVTEQPDLMQVGADAVCVEETEAAVALARMVLLEMGADATTVMRETIRVRQELSETA